MNFKTVSNQELLQRLKTKVALERRLGIKILYYLQETERRRKVQEEYNLKHGITPETIVKEVKRSDLPSAKKARISKWYSYDPADKETEIEHLTPTMQMERLQKEMERAVKELKFEKAMYLREQMLKIRKQL